VSNALKGRTHSSTCACGFCNKPKGFGLGHQVSQETKEKIRLAKLGKPNLKWSERFAQGHIRLGKMGHGRGGSYRGTWFRSRWERNVARVLDLLGLTWEYERSVRLSDGGFRPDFYLPELDLWLEVKGFSTERFERRWLEFSLGRNVRLVDESVYRVLVKTFGWVPGWEFS
jgi:hypothetical protein